MTIGIWGDSIVYGSCDSEALGWVGRLRKTLSVDDYSNLYNFGVCGDTTEDLLKRFVVEATAIRPDRIIFAVGINDSKFLDGSKEHNVSLGDYEKNIKTLLDTAKEHTDNIVLVGATRVYEERCNSAECRFLNEEIKKFNDVMKKISISCGLTFVDVFEVLEPATDLADGVHPNAKGYQKMFDQIHTQLDLKKHP